METGEHGPQAVRRSAAGPSVRRSAAGPGTHDAGRGAPTPRRLIGIASIACALLAPGCTSSRRVELEDAAADAVPHDGAATDRDASRADQLADGAAPACTAPGGSWAAAGEASGYLPPYAGSIAVDHAGNSYVTGDFQGTGLFGSSHTSKGEYDIFVARLDSGGRYVWSRTFGGAGDDRAGKATVDGAGNTYVSGTFEGTATFGASVLTSTGQRDAFVAKLDRKGKLLWARSLGAAAGFGGGIGVDGKGNSYVTGSFSGYVTKVDPAGKVLWTATGGTGLNGGGVFVDSAGSCYVTGGRNHLMGEDLFVTKVGSGGKILWTSTAAGGTSYLDHARGNDVAVDGAGNSHVTGSFAGTLTIASTTLSSPPYCVPSGCAPTYRFFVTKLDPAGKFLWVSSGGDAVEFGSGIAVDKAGNSYVTGSFSYLGDATLGSLKLKVYGLDTIFVTKLDTGGKYLWAKTTGGLKRENHGRGVALDCAGDLYLAGEFGATATFGATTLTSKWGYSAFIWKLGAGSP